MNLVLALEGSSLSVEPLTRILRGRPPLHILSESYMWRSLPGKLCTWAENTRPAVGIGHSQWAWEMVYLSIQSIRKFLRLIRYRVLPSINWRPSRWAWFGQSLWPYQPFWLPHQRSRLLLKVWGCYAERAGENTALPLRYKLLRCLDVEIWWF